MLDDPGEPFRRLKVHRVPVPVESLHPRPLRALERVLAAGERQAALHFLVRVRECAGNLGQRQDGVHHNPCGGHAVVVGELVDEEALAHAHLGGCEAHAVGGVVRFEHVGDEGAEFVVEDFHFGGPAVENRLAPDGDRQNGHVRRFL
ncbi:hypothetical protein D9M72_345640 [compost metagenome]